MMVPPRGPGNSENLVPLAARKILLVLEDNPSVMMFLRFMLERYSLIETNTAEEAFRFFDHGRRIDFLIADVTLPTSSGIQVALLLRSSDVSILYWRIRRF